MRLYNFWWLLIWPFLFGGVTFFINHKQKEVVLGRRCVRWHWFFAAIMASPYVVWAAWRGRGYGDTAMYQRSFTVMPTGLSNLGAYLATLKKERGFALFEYLFKTIISDSYTAFFLVIALIQVFCLVYMYRKYSRNYWLSMFFFIASTDYVSWMHNGMRQFLAASLIFAFLPLIIEKKRIAMVLVVLLASQIHLSALIFLPFIFMIDGKAWNIRTVIFLLVVIASFFFLDRVTGFITEVLQDTVYEADINAVQNDDGTNILRVAFYSVPAIMAFIFRRYVDAAEDPFINMCVNLSIVTAGFYLFSHFTSGILMGRIPIYFSLTNYILIPWLISEVFVHSTAILMEIVFVCVYSFFFYYQLGITWNMLKGRVFYYYEEPR